MYRFRKLQTFAWGPRERKVDHGQLVLFILQISSSSFSKVNKIWGSARLHTSVRPSHSFSEIHSDCDQWSEVLCCQLSETQLDSSHSPILSELPSRLKDQNTGDSQHSFHVFHLKRLFFNFCQISERGQRCLLAVCLNSELFSLQEGFAKEVARYIIAVAYANKTLQDALGHHLARARFLYI